jgi:hypothetical protein
MAVTPFGLIQSLGVTLACQDSGHGGEVENGAPVIVAAKPEAAKEELSKLWATALAPIESWTGRIVEETFHVKDGVHVPRSRIEVAATVAGPFALLTPTSGGESPPVAAAIRPDGAWIRTPEGLMQRNALAQGMLWNFPFVHATETTWKSISVPTLDKWHAVTREVREGIREFTIDTAVERGGYSKYVVRFDVDGDMVDIVGYSWEIWNKAHGGTEFRKVLSVKTEVKSLQAVGKERIPARLVRTAWQIDSDGTVVVEAMDRTEVVGVQSIGEDEALGKIDSGIRPRLGETVDIESRSIRFAMGENWMVVAGVRFETDDYFFDHIPSGAEIEQIMQKSRRIEGEAIAPAPKSG